MSLPNIPDIKPIIKLKRTEVIHLVIASIAMEEISLSHIMNAEAEKMQAVLKLNPCISELLEMNRSVERTMRNVIKKQMLLQFKMEDILSYDRGELAEVIQQKEKDDEEEEKEVDFDDDRSMKFAADESDLDFDDADMDFDEDD